MWEDGDRLVYEAKETQGMVVEFQLEERKAAAAAAAASVESNTAGPYHIPPITYYLRSNLWTPVSLSHYDAKRMKEAITKATDKVKLAREGTVLGALFARSEFAFQRELQKALERPIKSPIQVPINELSEAEGGRSTRAASNKAESPEKEAAAERKKQLLELRKDVRCLPFEVKKLKHIVESVAALKKLKDIVESVAALKLKEIWFVFDTNAHYVAFKANGRAMEAIHELHPKHIVPAVEGSFTDAILLDEALATPAELEAITYSSTLGGMALEFKTRCVTTTKIWDATE
jgi:hypothetical protein